MSNHLLNVITQERERALKILLGDVDEPCGNTHRSSGVWQLNKDLLYINIFKATALLNSARFLTC